MKPKNPTITLSSVTFLPGQTLGSARCVYSVGNASLTYFTTVVVTSAYISLRLPLSGIIYVGCFIHFVLTPLFSFWVTETLSTCRIRTSDLHLS